MTILVFGKSGQVATELAKLPDTRCLARADADLSDPAACAAAVLSIKPRAVINAAAYTDVDRAETDQRQAKVINADAPGAIATACATLEIPMIQISTDYVFDGSGSAPWQPTDLPAPLSVYGQSKLYGEDAIRSSGCTHAIVRTSWVMSPYGQNFLTTMLRLGAECDRITVVADQIGGPTTAQSVAETCHAIALQLIDDPTKSGTYHFAGAPDCSWADLARAIFNASQTTCTVVNIPSTDYPRPAKRPANSRLDCRSLTQTFAITRPDWRSGVADILTKQDQAKP